MEELFREILVPVPSGEAVTAEEHEQQEEGDKGGKCGSREEKKDQKCCGDQGKMDLTSSSDDEIALSADEQSVDWANEIEMQRILDSLQQSSSAQQAFAGQDFTMNSVVDLGLGLLSWNEAEGMNSNGVDVF